MTYYVGHLFKYLINISSFYHHYFCNYHKITRINFAKKNSFYNFYRLFVMFVVFIDTLESCWKFKNKPNKLPTCQNAPPKTNPLLLSKNVSIHIAYILSYVCIVYIHNCKTNTYIPCLLLLSKSNKYHTKNKTGNFYDLLYFYIIIKNL